MPSENHRLGSPRTAAELLDMYYLAMRSSLVETAATLDRIQTAPGGEDVLQDPRLRGLLDAAGVIGEAQPGRTGRFLHALSVPEGEPGS